MEEATRDHVLRHWIMSTSLKKELSPLHFCHDMPPARRLHSPSGSLPSDDEPCVVASVGTWNLVGDRHESVLRLPLQVSQNHRSKSLLENHRAGRHSSTKQTGFYLISAANISFQRPKRGRRGVVAGGGPWTTTPPPPRLRGWGGVEACINHLTVCSIRLPRLFFQVGCFDVSKLLAMEALEYADEHADIHQHAAAGRFKTPLSKEGRVRSNWPALCCRVDAFMLHSRNAIVPTRFLVTIAHLTSVIMCFLGMVSCCELPASRHFHSSFNVCVLIRILPTGK
jgi:hypothetical protein